MLPRSEAESFSPIPPIADLIHLNITESPAGYGVSAHIHHFHQLDVILSGRLNVEIEGQEQECGTEGTAWLIPPLVQHAFVTPTGYRQCSFKMYIAPRYWPFFGTGFLRYQIPSHLMRTIEETGSRFLTDSPLAEIQMTAVATLCLSECLLTSGRTREEDGSDAFRQVLWPLLEQIEIEPGAPWTVKEMATRCHMSPDYFSRCFHRLLRQSPQQYLIETRMRAGAAALVRAPDQSIKAIAETTGYATVPSFTRAFRQIFQTTPAAYRRTQGKLVPF